MSRKSKLTGWGGCVVPIKVEMYDKMQNSRGDGVKESEYVIR